MFLISAQNVDCGRLLERPRRGGSNEWARSVFWGEIREFLAKHICCRRYKKQYFFGKQTGLGILGRQFKWKVFENLYIKKKDFKMSSVAVVVKIIT